MTYSRAVVERAGELRRSGLSCREIARELDGPSKSAVVDWQHLFGRFREGQRGFADHALPVGLEARGAELGIGVMHSYHTLSMPMGCVSRRGASASM